MSSSHDGPSGSSDDRPVFMQRCPLCHGAFEQKNIVMLETREQYQTVHSHCPLCGVALLAMIISSQGGTGLVAMVTDLSADDAVLLLRKPFICDDDILSCHQLLKRPGALEHRMWSSHGRTDRS